MSERKRKFFMFICVVIFVFSAVRLGMYFMEYRKGDSIYEEARRFVVVSEGLTQTETESEEIKREIDFKSLKDVNNDIVAWIYVEETPIDYPVLVGLDNAYYLNRTYDKQWSSFGSIFLDMDNRANFSDRHVIVYGHNMKNESMFGILDKYQKQDFYDAHPYIYIYTEKGEMIYQVFSVYTTHVDDATYSLSFAVDEQFMYMVNFMKASSLFESDLEIDANDQILTLSTCTSNSSTMYRFVVNAVLIEDNQGEAASTTEGE